MDDVFEFLQNADEQLEKHGNAIEAATKYYEAVYLMRQYMSRIPTNHSPKNRAIYALLQEKIVHYEKVAPALLSQPTALSPTNKNSNDASSNNLALSQLSIQGGRIGNNDHARSPLSNFDFPTGNWSDPSSPKLLEQRNPKNSSRSSNSKSPADLDKREIQYRNQQAILALSQAIDDDERMINNITKHGTKNKPCIGNAADVITKYMEAAEHFLEAMQKLRNMKSCNNDENNSDQIDAVMKQRLQQIFDRVEVLKLQQYPRHNSSEAYVSAPYQQLEQNTATTSTKDATLTAEEVQVLKQSSFIASGSFLPWSDGDATRFNTECCEQRKQNRLTTSFSNLFTDPAGFLTLSTRQKEHFYAWARPNEIIRIRQQHNNILSSLKLRGFSGAISSATSGGDNNIVAMRPSSISPYTIQQKYITECSFIASLCICANYERKFHKPLVSSILYPQAKDIKTGKLQPMYNPNGKYMVKLWLNGSPRCVIVDDYLPIDKHGNILCSQSTSCTTSNNKLELWVCLIEKAYMKLCGGYNFPGSNSGVTLFALTGWIPEQICFTLHNSLQKDRAASAADVSENITSDEEMSSERVWERIYSASSFGDCLITISTISNSHGNEETMSTVGLISGHSYAVLSVVQTTNGARLLKLKNPWAQQGWKGRYSCFDNHGWRSSKLRNELGYDPTLAKNQDDGVFWICWDDILHYFQEFYLLWNPKLFSKRHVLHGHWSENQGPTDDTFNIGENPQYVVTLSDQAVSKKSTLWILISRHVTKQEHEGEEVNDYLTVHIHRAETSKERIWYTGKNGRCALPGCYTNNPHVLVRYDVKDKGDKHLALILSQFKKSNDLNYTLSCYCTEDFEINSPQPNLEIHTKASSTWTTYTAGGPIGCNSFDTNPQYYIFIPYSNINRTQSAEIQLSVSSTATTAVNALLFPVEKGGGTDLIFASHPVIDTGNYRHGFVVSNRTTIPSGAYKLVVSNYHVGQVGFFTLTVSSNIKNITIEKINCR